MADKTQPGKGRRARPRGPRKGGAGKARRRKVTKHDWQALGEEFLRIMREDGQAVTLEWFAQEKGIPAGMLRLRAAKDKWLEKREQFRSKTHALAREKATERIAAQVAKQDEKDFNVATGIIDLTQDNVDVLRKAGKGSRPTDLDKMASASERAQRVHRIAAGRSLPSEGGQQQVNVNVHQSGVDPMERIRRKFAACKDAGMDVEATALDFCQMVIDDLLGPDYVLELKRRKALKEAR